MSLREKVCIKTLAGDLDGELFVGVDGLPELRMVKGDVWSPCVRPATCPATWTLSYVLDPNTEPILYPAWQAIERIQQQIRDAQREAEAMEKG